MTHGSIAWWGEAKRTPLTWPVDARTSMPVRVLFDVLLARTRDRLPTYVLSVKRQQLIAEHAYGQSLRYADLWDAVEARSPWN